MAKKSHPTVQQKLIILRTDVKTVYCLLKQYPFYEYDLFE